MMVAAPSPVRVGTYNIRVSSADVNSTNAWKYRKGDLTNLVHRLDLDVVGFQEVRPNQLEFLREAFPKGTPVILVGDHNCRENAKPAQQVAAKMRNVLYATQTPPKGPWRTFTGWRWVERETPAAEAIKVDVSVRNANAKSPEGQRIEDGIPVFRKYGARIDYIYVSEGVKVLDYETHADERSDGHFYPSDHFPVTATVEL